MGCPQLELIARQAEENMRRAQRQGTKNYFDADVPEPSKTPSISLPYKVVLDIMHFRDGQRHAAVVYVTARPRPKKYAREVPEFRGYGVAVRAPEDQKDGQDLQGEEMALERAIEHAGPEVQTAVRNAWAAPEQISTWPPTKGYKVRLPRWRRISRAVDVEITEERALELAAIGREMSQQEYREQVHRSELADEHMRVVNAYQVIERQRGVIDRLNKRISELVNQRPAPAPFDTDFVAGFIPQVRATGDGQDREAEPNEFERILVEFEEQNKL